MASANEGGEQERQWRDGAGEEGAAEASLFVQSAEREAEREVESEREQGREKKKKKEKKKKPNHFFRQCSSINRFERRKR